jgi:CheY-like chemotaxis protein
MAKVLLVDDLPPERQRIAKALSKPGHNVISVQGNTTDTLFAETKLWLDENADVVFDVLILDIAYDKHTLGGLVLYQLLEEQGYISRWRHLILFTQLVSQAQERDFARLEAFLINRHIPMENLISKHPTKLDNLIDRVAKLTDDIG